MVLWNTGMYYKTQPYRPMRLSHFMMRTLIIIIKIILDTISVQMGWCTTRPSHNLNLMHNKWRGTRGWRSLGKKLEIDQDNFLLLAMKIRGQREGRNSMRGRHMDVATWMFVKPRQKISPQPGVHLGSVKKTTHCKLWWAECASWSKFRLFASLDHTDGLHYCQQLFT